MIPLFVPQVLTEREIADIHQAMLRMLSRTGLKVENRRLREILGGLGGLIDEPSERVRFPEDLVERFIADAPRHSPPDRPNVSCSSGIYNGYYLDPTTGGYQPFTPETLAGYVKLARLLPEVDGVHVLNLPTASRSPVEPLLARLFAWKHGVADDGGIQQTRLCPYILEMYGIKAAADGVPVAEIFRGGVFFVSPLRLPASEAEQLMYFHERGLRVWMANMITLGAQGPATLAGSVALNLAERIAIGIINKALFGDGSWSIESMIAPMDMRTMMRPYGRPEMLLAGLASLQLARHYQVPGWAHAGLTDAKTPSTEAGAQKMMTALPLALAGGANVEPGLLAVDEVFSPVQMVLDAEMAGAVRRICRGFEVNHDTLAVDAVERAGPGGMFTADEHTAAWFRSEIWQPSVWSDRMLSAWLPSPRKDDAARARDIWEELMRQPDEEPSLAEETELRLLEVVRRAGERAGPS